MAYTKSSFFGPARKALKKKSKFVDDRGLDTRKNYSSFWMDDRWDAYAKFSGLSGNSARQGTDMVKLIKLSNYRRAITNFVKIVTKREIPVQWAGSDSYTDGESITLSTDIKDNNFDVSVGLALHEASHIVLTDFEVLKNMHDGKYPAYNALVANYVPAPRIVKSLLNWIEDRRIDNYIFTTSPGYKAYYHKLYDYYWNSKDIIKGMLSADFRNPEMIDHYEFHIINMMNPCFNPKALPGLEEITKIIGLRNIARIKDTEESLDIAVKVAEIILTQVMDARQKSSQESGDGEQDNNSENGTPQASNGSGQSSDEQGTQNDTQASNMPGEGEGETTPLEELTPAEIRAVERALEKQKGFLSGNTGKKKASAKLTKQLNKVAEQDIDIQAVGGEDGVSSQTALLYDYTKDSKLLQAHELALTVEGAEWKQRHDAEEKIKDLIDDDVMSHRAHPAYINAAKNGFDMGALLGKKLQLHNESRERVDTRLRSGKIDNKRLAHAGYGIEGIFKQIHVDKYKKANLHISLDGSGSMGGDKWTNTIKMTAAIVKAATYTQNINVQVSIRATSASGRSDTPANILIYDSRKNKTNQLIAAFSMFSPNSMTPEGLCFEAMLKKNLLIQSTNDLDSYFLNLSDGQPGTNSYGGDPAIAHTKKQVDKLRSYYDMQVISFFITQDRGKGFAVMQDAFMNNSDGIAFRKMYGKDATIVEASNTLQIAKELNKKFLNK